MEIEVLVKTFNDGDKNKITLVFPNASSTDPLEPNKTSVSLP